MPQVNFSISRLGDGFAVGLTRFVGPGDRAIWMLGVSPHTSHPPLIEMVATREALRDLQQFCTEAQKLLATDGGRDEPPGAAKEPA